MVPLPFMGVEDLQEYLGQYCHYRWKVWDYAFQTVQVTASFTSEMNWVYCKEIYFTDQTEKYINSAFLNLFHMDLDCDIACCFYILKPQSFWKWVKYS